MRAATAVFERKQPAIILLKDGGMENSESDHMITEMKNAYEQIRTSSQRPLFLVSPINTNDVTT